MTNTQKTEYDDGFSFDVVQTQILLVYGKNKNTEHFPWHVVDYIRVFKKFYDTYAGIFGFATGEKIHHPQMPNSFVLDVMRKLPSDGYHEYLPEDYKDVLIPMYFDTEYDGNEQGACNYSLKHFVSGDVRNILWMRNEINGYSIDEW